MRLRWSSQAADDLESIKKYLDRNRPELSELTLRAIYSRIFSLKNSPQRFRRGESKDTREMSLSPLPCVVVYSVKTEAVEILHIYHGSQDWRRLTPLD